MIKKINLTTYALLFVLFYLVFLYAGLAYASEISGNLSTDFSLTGHFSEISGILAFDSDQSHLFGTVTGGTSGNSGGNNNNNNNNGNNGSLQAVVITSNYKPTSENINTGNNNTPSPYGPILAFGGGPSDIANNYLTYTPSELQSIVSDNVPNGNSRSQSPLLPNTGSNSDNSSDQVTYNSLNGDQGQNDQVAAVGNNGFSTSLIIALAIIGIIILASIGYAVSRSGNYSR